MAGGSGRPQSRGVGVNRVQRRGESDAYKSRWFMDADFEKISATSLDPLPRRREQNDPVVADSEDEHISNAESYVETDVDSSVEQNTSELAQSQPSRLHQAVRIEVRLRRLPITVP
jgi:hypothetical protein